MRLPKSFVSGQSIKNYRLRIDSDIEQVGIVFKPTGLFHLFGIPSFELTNTRIDIHDIITSNFHDIEEQLHEVRESAGRIKLLEKMLLQKLIKNAPVLDGVDYGSQRIINEFGNVNIGDLLEETYMSRRKFERHFFRRVGLSPKYYARIRRYGAMCAFIAGKRSVNWDEVLYHFSYYDQSHFIKDFKEFSGKSPSEYLITNNELAHQVEAMTV